VPCRACSTRSSFRCARRARRAVFPSSTLLDDADQRCRDAAYEQVPSDHPLWVVYSSGTTGLPKAIVHGHAGVLLEMLKGVHLHRDIGPEDRFFWYTTNRAGSCGTLQVSDCWPVPPRCCTTASGHSRPWHPVALVERVRATFFGAGAAFFASCIKAGIEPAKVADLASLRYARINGIAAAGEAYRWPTTR